MNAAATIATGQAQAAPVMTCRGIVARYSRITVVEEVDFDLYPGEMLAVLGPNGAGKSSMLGAVSGIISGAGDVKVRGTEIGGMSAHKRASHGIAFVPERRGNIFPTMSVEENIDVGLRLLPVQDREAQRELILSLFPILKQRADAMAGVLSGGEQQMLAIGMALGRKPQVLLLDEPTQGLAPMVFDILENAFNILKNSGLALLLAEQNVPFAARVAERYVVLSHGHLVRQGGKEDLSNPEELAEAFLGTANG